jgi:hypothetical protein
MNDKTKMTFKELHKWYNRNSEAVDAMLMASGRDWYDFTYEQALEVYNQMNPAEAGK